MKRIKRKPGIIVDRFLVISFEIVLIWLALVLLFYPNWPVCWKTVIVVPQAIFSMNLGPILSSPAVIPVPRTGIVIRVDHPGYASMDTLILPEMPDTVILSLQYRFLLNITSTPAGASVQIDGVLQDSITPMVLIDLSPGVHFLELNLNGTIRRDTLTLLQNQPAGIHFSLPPSIQDGMICISGGWIITNSQDNRFNNTDICRHVEFLDEFWICDHEVTVGEFCAFLNAIDPLGISDTTCSSGSTLKLEELIRSDFRPPIEFEEESYIITDNSMQNHPVFGVTFAAAEEYCRWLSENDRNDLIYRLPSGMEWEHAARGGLRDGLYPWGDSSPDGSQANLSDICETITDNSQKFSDGFEFTAPVRSYPPNGYGLYDMCGNVWEWCLDDLSGTAGFADEFSTGYRAVRGGSWISDPSDCCCSSVQGLDKNLGYAFTGFRVVRECLSETTE